MRVIGVANVVVPSKVLITSVVVFIVMISVEPPMVLFGLFVCYALSGYLIALLRLRRNKQDDTQDTGPQ